MRNDCQKSIFFLVVWIILLLDVSTATWSPHQPPKRLSSHHHSSHNNDNNNNNNNNNNNVVRVRQQYIINGDTPRGGSTVLQSPPPPPPPPPLSQEIEVERQATNRQDYENQYHYHHDHDDLLYHSPEQDKDQDQRETFISPKIHLKHVAEALLHTSEWNRRLRQGLKYWGTRRNESPLSQSLRRNIEYHHQQELHSSYNFDNDVHNNYYSHHQQQERSMHFGNLPVNVHPSRTWQPPIQASSGRLLEEEELSLFHAKIPERRSSSSQSSSEIDNGIEKFKEEDGYNKEKESEEEVTKNELDDDDIRYWGPDLLPYLEYICDRLGIDNNGVELSLAMIYMDRACSVETSRSNDIPSCPFCTPRTVHRLSLAAFIISLQAVCGGEQQQQLQLLSVSLGIPLLQLQQMVEWMLAALGDGGLLVTMKELISWNRSLEAIFSSSSN